MKVKNGKVGNEKLKKEKVGKLEHWILEEKEWWKMLKNKNWNDAK